MSNTSDAPADVMAWRKARRSELISRRAAMAAAERDSLNRRISSFLERGFEMPGDVVIGFCWPFKGEFDARHVLKRWRERGARAALPEVVSSGAPLQFRLWQPGVPMRPGVYDIPVPDGTPVVAPDVAIVPMNAFDKQGYRLGYGGAFFDRTLGALERRVVAIGVAYDMLSLETIHPQPHDIPMDFVVTESGVHTAAGGRLERVDEDESRRRLARLLLARRLPRAAFPSDELSSPVCYASDFPGYWSGDTRD